MQDFKFKLYELEERIEVLEESFKRHCKKRKSDGYTKSIEHPEDAFRYNIKCLKVKCVETGVVYDSIRQAARMTSTHPVYVSQCINGARETAAGYHWITVEKSA